MNRYGGRFELVNPTVTEMKHACEMIENVIAQAKQDNPDLDEKTVRTRFAGCQDLEGGTLRIRIYWTAQGKEE